MSVSPSPASFEKQIEALLESYDTNGDGKYGKAEVRLLVSDLQKQTSALADSKAARKRLSLLSFLIVGLLALSLLGNFLMTFAVIVMTQVVKSSGSVLQDTSGNAMHTGGIHIDAAGYPATRRRLREVRGRKLVEIGEASPTMCHAAKSAAELSGVYEGYVSVVEDGSSVKTHEHGSVVDEEAETDAMVYSVVGENGDKRYVTVPTDSSLACPYAEEASSRLRELVMTPEEMTAFAGRRQLQGLNATRGLELFVPDWACVVYHCFAGEAGCTDPSPAEACMHWDGGVCAEPLCRYHKLDPSLAERHSEADLAKAAARMLQSDCPGIEGSIAPDQVCTASCECEGSETCESADGQMECTCFPSSAVVTLANGTPVRVDTLKAGDEIFAATAEGKLTTDTVSLLSHAKSDQEADFIKITVAIDAADGPSTDLTLSATPDHRVSTGPTCCSELTAAGSVRVGDTLWAHVGGATAIPTTVKTLSATTDRGLHSPVLTNGNYPIINGVVTSFDHAAGVAVHATLDPIIEPVLSALCGSACLSLARRLFFPAGVRYIDGYESPPRSA
jgi:hypothetical protein